MALNSFYKIEIKTDDTIQIEDTKQCAVNHLYLSLNNSQIAPIDEIDKLSSYSLSMPNKIRNISFCPTNPNCIASTTLDNSLQILDIYHKPNMKPNLILRNLDFDQQLVHFMKWHPLQENKLLTVYESKLTIWNLINNEALNEYIDDCLILSAEWSTIGTFIAILTSEQQILILDNQMNFVSKFQHETNEISVHNMRVLFLENEQIFYLGYSEHSIEYSVFNFDGEVFKELLSEALPNKNKTDLNSIFYDKFTSLIYLLLGNEIQCFEYKESMLNFKQRIVAESDIDSIFSMPNAGINVKINEIARFYFINSEKKMKIVSIQDSIEKASSETTSKSNAKSNSRKSIPELFRSVFSRKGSFKNKNRNSFNEEQNSKRSFFKRFSLKKTPKNDNFEEDV